MTFTEGFAGLQLVAEEEIGVLIRQHARRENASEDQSMEALRREQLEKL
jgi:hypothetical protein